MLMKKQSEKIETVVGGNEIVKSVGVVFSKPNERRNYSAWPNVARLSDGRLMAVWSGNRLAHTDPWGAIVASYSSDDGVTWTEPTLIFDSPLDDRDPNLYIEEDTIFIGYFTQWDIYRPDNGYHTAEDCAQWSKYYYSVTAEDVEKYGSLKVNGISNNYIISRDGGQTFEYGGKISAHTPKGVIKLQDGRYFYVTTHEETDGKSGKLSYITSSNLTNWSEKMVIHDVSAIPTACEPTAYQTESGRIIVLLRSSAGLYQCYSDNNGESFTELKFVDAYAVKTPANLIKHSSSALVMTYAHRETPYGIVARISYDDGETWSEHIDLYCTGSSWDLGYTSTVEREDGTLLTIWYGRANASDRNCGIHYMIWRLPNCN